VEQDKIEELDKKLSGLFEQRNKLNSEAIELAEKRNKLNDRFNTLRTEALELKNERDQTNENVKWLKQKRSELNAKIHEKIEEVKKLRQQNKETSQRTSFTEATAIQKEIDDIEWKIQTTPMNLKQERTHVERIKELQLQLNSFKKLEKLRKRISELQTEIDNLENEGKQSHEKLTQLAQKSQEVHEKMIAKVADSKKTKAEADNLHQLFVQTKEKARPIQDEIASIIMKLKQHKAEIREKEEERKKKSEETLRGKLESQAKEKRKRGEKLTWDEFQILAEKEMGEQD
jgi:uncharacterized coiled-coil DUF342 family protein